MNVQLGALSSAEKGKAAHDLLVSRGIYPTNERTEAIKPYLQTPYVDAIMTQIRANAYNDGNDVSKIPVKTETPVFAPIAPIARPETFIVRQVDYSTPKKSGIGLALAAVAAYFALK